jgi:hypothetical protein
MAMAVLHKLAWCGWEGNGEGPPATAYIRGTPAGENGAPREAGQRIGLRAWLQSQLTWVQTPASPLTSHVTSQATEEPWDSVLTTVKWGLNG